MPPPSRREGQQMVSSSTIALLLFLILPLLAQAIPLSGPRLSRQLSPPQQQQNAAFQPPSSTNSFAGAVAGAPFSAQAFDPKLESARFEAPPPPPPNSGLPQQQQQQQPQFVANNGPLIRTPDGQFVLAPVNSLPHQHFGAASFQAGPVNGQPHLLPQQQFFFTPAAQQQQQQSFGGNNNLPPPPFIPPAPISLQHQSQLQQQSLAAARQPDGSPSSIQLTNSSNISNDTSSSSSSSSSSADAAHHSLPPPLLPSSFPTSTRPPPPVDKSVDLDGDGALSLNEVQYAAFVHHGLSSSVVENLFNEVDHNKDNFLSALEFNDIRPLVLSKAENAALRYLQNVDSDHNGLLSLPEAQAYILREYGISNRDVERIWRLVVPSSSDEMDAVLFSKLRRRVRGMSIRLARQIMKAADRDQDGHIDLREAQLIAFEQEGIGPAEVVEMLASVDDNSDGQLNAPEFADFERIVRAKAVETSKKALKVVDADGSGSLTMDEAKKIAFDHYGFDEATLEPFFAQADENEDGQLDAVEFAGFRSVIRGRAVKNALGILPEMDEDGDGVISEAEAEQRTRKDDDMSASETHGLFSIADQDRNGLLDKVELADFVRLVRLTSIKFVADHFRDYDSNRDKLVTLDELERLVKDRYKLDAGVTRRFFDKVDVDRSGDLNAGEIVDFRREIRRFAQDRAMQAELEEQNRREMAEIEQKMREEANQKELKTGLDPKGVRNEEGDSEKIVEDGNEGEDGNDDEDGSEEEEEEDEEKRRVAEEMEKKRSNKKRKNKKKIDKHEEEGEEEGQQHGQAMHPEGSMNNDGGRSGTAMMVPTTSESTTTTTVIRTMMTTTTVSSTATPTTETRMMMNEEQLNSGGQARTNETSLRNVKDNGQDGEEDEERAVTKVLLINQETVNRMDNNENNNSSSIHGNLDGDKGKMPIKMEDSKNDNLSVQHRGENMVRENVLVQTTSNNNLPSMSHPVMTKKDGITTPPSVTESTIIEEMTTMKKMRKRRRKTTTAIPSTTTVAASESYEEDETVGEVEKRKIK